jgi:ribosomal protein S18 acetylase RimI-like enzyme
VTAGPAPEAAPFAVEVRPYLHPDVVRMVAEVQAEYVTRYGGPDRDAIEPGEFEPPSGLFLVGLLDGESVAMGGWRWLDPTTAEIKRMYVSVAARRHGLGATMLAALERTAHAAGVTSVVLTTGGEQPEAVAMYERAGYRRVAGFGHYADVPGAMFYGRALQ